MFKDEVSSVVRTKICTMDDKPGESECHSSSPHKPSSRQKFYFTGNMAQLHYLDKTGKTWKPYQNIL